jgi:hypothetical protein
MIAPWGPGAPVPEAAPATQDRTSPDPPSGLPAADLFGLLLGRVVRSTRAAGSAAVDVLDPAVEPPDTRPAPGEPARPGGPALDPGPLAPPILAMLLEPAGIVAAVPVPGTTSGDGPSAPADTRAPRSGGVTLDERGGEATVAARGAPVPGAPGDPGMLAPPERGPEASTGHPLPPGSAGLPGSADSGETLDVSPTPPPPAPRTTAEPEPPLAPGARGPEPREAAAPVTRERIEGRSLGTSGPQGRAREVTPPEAASRAVDRTTAAEIGLQVRGQMAAVPTDPGSHDATRRPVRSSPDGRPTGPDSSSGSAVLRAESTEGSRRDEPTGHGASDREQGARSDREAPPQASRPRDGDLRIAAASVTADRAPDAPGPGAGDVRVPRPVVEQLVERLRVIRGEGRHELSLRLDPPELGVVRVEAVMHGHRLALLIHAEGEHARDALAQALPRLREALAQHGIVVEHSRVSLGLDASGGGDAQRGHRPFVPEAPLPRSGRPEGRAATRLAPTAPSPGGVDLWA